MLREEGIRWCRIGSVSASIGPIHRLLGMGHVDTLVGGLASLTDLRWTSSLADMQPTASLLIWILATRREASLKRLRRLRGDELISNLWLTKTFVYQNLHKVSI